MRLDVKRKLAILGISFITTLVALYYFISNYYTGYRLNKIVNEKYIQLEDAIINNVEKDLNELNAVNGNEIDEFYESEKKDSDSKYSVYEIEKNDIKIIKGVLEVKNNIISKLIEKDNKNIGIFINENKLMGFSRKVTEDKNYIIIKEIYNLTSNKDVIFENLSYSAESIEQNGEKVTNSNLVDIRIIKQHDTYDYDDIFLIKNYLAKDSYIGLRVNTRYINNSVMTNVVLVLLILYGIVTTIFAILFFKIINKRFFMKISALENRIKELIDEPENPEEIIKEMNLDSIDYIESNINTIISSVNEYKEIVDYYSKYDSLTSLMNRETFMKDGDIEFLNKTVKGLVYINLDGFSYYNNNFGYVKGDEILREVSKIIVSFDKSTNLIARIGGDEFAILLLDGEKRDITDYVEGLMKEINLLTFSDIGNFISASVGISIKTEKEKNTVELINNAYLAMVSVKEKQKNGYEFFTDSHKNEITIGMIQNAMEAGNIQVHYQPKVNVQTNEIDGVEALVRWFDEEKGYISPLTFIKVAEDTGYIITFGEWILRKAIKDIKALNKELNKELSVAINVSPIQFMQKNFVDTVERILKEENMNPRNIELELTESIGIFNSTYVTNTFDRLSNLGVSIAIDDFGTGYSCIKYLKEFKINTIKIDRTFVQSGGKNISLIKYIIDVCKILGFTVVAEGIEEYKQARILKNLCCDYMQGYFFFRPMPINKLRDVVLSGDIIKIN